MIKWEEKFSVGYPLFDDQHKELIRILNNVADLIKDKQMHDDVLYDQLSLSFDELLKYTEYHFTSEEKLFEKANYAEAQRHKEEHAIFIENIKDLLSGFELGKDERKVALEIYNQLLDWLMMHIMDSDKKYVGKLG